MRFTHRHVPKLPFLWGVVARIQRPSDDAISQGRLPRRATRFEAKASPTRPPQIKNQVFHRSVPHKILVPTVVVTAFLPHKSSPLLVFASGSAQPRAGLHLRHRPVFRSALSLLSLYSVFRVVESFGGRKSGWVSFVAFCFEAVSSKKVPLMSSDAGATTAVAAASASGVSASATPYWCYQCARFVRVWAGEAVVCPYCETGFVELLGTPGALPGPAPARRRAPLAAMYMVNSPSVASAPSRSHRQPEAGSRRSRRNTAGSRPPYNPVIVMRGPSDSGTGDADVGRAAAAFELYYDGGAGLRPVPAVMSEFLMGSGFTRLLEQVAQMDASAVGGRDLQHPPASKAAVEAMPIIEIAEDHIRTEAHCAICKEPFELGGEAREMPCKHIFHQDCILPWLSQRNSCPVCRHEMPTDVESPRVATGSQREEEAAAGDGEEEAVGLTIWRLPGGGFAVGRFSGGRRAVGRELPLVYTEVDGGLNADGAGRRISWSSTGGRSRESGGVIGRVFRNFFACVGRLLGSSSSSSSHSGSGSSSSGAGRTGSILGRNSRRHGNG
ncbi:hypothetical protein Taro_003318 [Colocasia esculenta]|uniref:RING-type E3 ubiquitin transferase n=1 Tax=Colocasia esculenta TaxID=4460 RepID=A0A843TLQ8_COLES|nr:hypothetical protein [Colocasia esculenta]